MQHTTKITNTRITTASTPNTTTTKKSMLPFSNTQGFLLAGGEDLVVVVMGNVTVVTDVAG